MIQFFLRATGWYLLRSLSRRQVLVGLLVCLLLGGGTGTLLTYRTLHTNRAQQIAGAWHQVEESLRRGDQGRAEKVFEILLQLDPDDPRVQRWAEGLRTGHGDASEPVLVQALMRRHLANYQWDASALEARKFVLSYPDDWEARCVVLHHALQQNRPAEIKEQLAALPWAREARRLIDPGTILHAFYLFNELGESERVRDLIDHMMRQLLPILRLTSAENLPPGLKLQFLECYRQALQRLDARPDLIEYWIPGQKLAHCMLTVDKVQGAQLVQLGLLQEDLRSFPQEFQRRKLIDAEPAAALRKETEKQLATIWDRVVQEEPTNPWGHLGQSLIRFRADDLDGALAAVERGLAACGQKSELIMTKAALLNLRDPAAGLLLAEQALRNGSGSLAVLKLLAESATAAGHPERVLEACRQAAKRQPNLLWAARLEASTLLQLDRPTEAAAALERLGAQLGKDGACAGLYVRALVACGAGQLADEFLDQVVRDKGPAEVVTAGAVVLLASGNPGKAGRRAEQMLQQDRENLVARALLGDCLRLQAERPGGWDIDLARRALREYEQVLAKEPHNLAVLHNVVWLQLKALNLPAVALRSAEPLRAQENSPRLSSSMLETLGAVYLSNKQFEDARLVLERAAAGAPPRASLYCHLAEAYLHLQRNREAEACLGRAAGLPKTPREAAAYANLVNKLRHAP